MTNDATIEAVIFDVGGVICELFRDAPVRYWHSVLGGDPAAIAKAYLEDSQPLQRGEITIEDYHRDKTRLLGKELSFEDFLTGWNSVIGPVLPGVAALLEALAPTLRLVCLTNTNASHHTTFCEYCADALTNFERVFASHEMKLLKPEEACYRQVLDYLQLRGEQVVFIDDTAVNVEGARRLGIKGIVAAGATQIAEELRRLGVPVDPQASGGKESSS